MREIMKTVEFELEGENKSFRLTKMNAFDGAYLMKIVTEKAMPLLQEAVASTRKGESTDLKLITDMLPRLLSSMSAEELKKLMILCLQTVDISLPAGYQKVVDSRGNFGIADLEYNTAACLRLMYEVVIFNCSGFFEESGLSSLLAGKTGSPQKRKT